MIIYKATNEITGRCYIGQTTKSLKIRKKQHETVNGSPYLYRSIQKHGKKNFKWEILEKCYVIDDLNMAEEWYIRYHHTFVPNGYNLTKGGDNISDIEASSKRMTENNPMKDPKVAKKVGKKVKKAWENKTYEEYMGEDNAIRVKAMASKRMTENNPMKDPDVVRRVVESKRKNGRFDNIVLTNEHKEKIRSGVSRLWELTNENEETFIIKNLNKFCRDNKLNMGYMCRISKGQGIRHRGWKCKKLKEMN